MIEFTEGQRKTVATGLTVLSLTLVVAFAAFTAWLVLKLLSFAAPAIVPVVLGFFLALFFKPYYGWWTKTLRNPTLALVALLVTVFVPVGLLLWYAGAVLVGQIANLMAQGPELVRQVTAWSQATFPNLHSLLEQVGLSNDSMGEFYTKYAPAAFKAGTGALKCLSGVLTALVTLIFFVFFLI